MNYDDEQASMSSAIQQQRLLFTFQFTKRQTF